MIPDLLLVQGSPLRDPVMDGAGWTFMGLAWLFVISLVVWCFVKVIWGDKPT